MKFPTSGALLAALILLPLSPSCECQDSSLLALEAEVQFSGEPMDFGEVPVGAQRTLLRELRNTGSAALRLQDIRYDPAVTVYRARFVPESIPARSLGQLEVVFAPEQTGRSDSTLTLRTNAVQRAELSISVLGEGVPPAITVQPAALDFGSLAFGERRQRRVRIANSRDFDQQVRLALEGTGTRHFEFVSPGDSGRLTVPALTEIEVEVWFAARWGGEHHAGLRVDYCGESCGQVVSLGGRCDAPRLQASPLQVDFGAVPVAQQAQQELRLSNTGIGMLSISSLELIDGAPAFGADLPALPLRLDSGESSTLLVRFGPVHAGEARGRLRITSDDPASPTGFIELRGRRSGAELQIVPGYVQFGITSTPDARHRNLLFINRGDAVAQLLDLSLTRGQQVFALGPLPPLPSAIEPGQVLALELEFFPVEPGSYFGNLQILSDVDGGQRVDVEMAGIMSDESCVLAPHADTMRFGNVRIGSVSSQSLVLNNLGNQPCELRSLSFSPNHINDPAFSYRAPADLRIDVGAQLVVPVQFAPSLAGQAKAALLARPQAPLAPPVLIGISGRGTRSGLTAAPPSLDFGSVAVNCSSVTRSVAISSIGGAPVDAGLASLSPSSSTDFAIASGASIGVLQPGRAHTLVLEFSPTRLGAASGELRVSPLGLNQVVRVPLTGLSVEARTTPLTETFGVQALSQVDVLFVVDNSGSMTDNQQNLADNFSHFIQYADIRGMQVDYQIGVVTTDMDDPAQSGRLLGSPRWLTQQAYDVESVFASRAQVGNVGSGWERGLEACMAALSPPLIDDPVYNQGFLRPNAALAIIVVSDEDDGSSESVESYVNYLLGLKAALGLPVLFNAVTGGPQGCTQGDVVAYPAPRYAEAIVRTGGESMSICSSDWGTDLESLGAGIFSATTRFTLQARPDPSTLSVRLNGSVVDPQNWSYDAASNTVTLLPAASAQPGDSVEVSYVLSC